MSAVQIRRASKDDIAAIAQIEVEGFSASLYHQALFPEHLRVNSAFQDHLEWSTRRIQSVLQSPSSGYVVATTEVGSGHDVVVGFAEWVAPGAGENNRPLPAEQGKTPEQEANENRQRLARLPAYIDTDAMLKCNEEVKQVIDHATPTLGDKRLSDMWSEFARCSCYRPDHLLKSCSLEFDRCLTKTPVKGHW